VRGDGYRARTVASDVGLGLCRHQAFSIAVIGCFQGHGLLHAVLLYGVEPQHNNPAFGWVEELLDFEESAA